MAPFSALRFAMSSVGLGAEVEVIGGGFARKQEQKEEKKLIGKDRRKSFHTVSQVNLQDKRSLKELTKFFSGHKESGRDVSWNKVPLE